MRVTFDTNALDRVVCPDWHPNDQHASRYQRIHDALANSELFGFFCDAMIRIEGMRRVDRAGTFDSTRLAQEIAEGENEDGVHTINLTLTVEQPAARPLHPQHAKRIRRALDLGLRLLSAPRVGAGPILEKKWYVPESDVEVRARLDRYHALGEALEQRGVGYIVVKQLGESFVKRDGIKAPWFKGVARARDVHEERAVERAFAEWADGDAVAAHYGYGIDLFCTNDRGRSAGTPSVLDENSKSWLTSTYGLQFVDLAELESRL